MHCTAWAQARDAHIQQVHTLVAKIPELPLFTAWPPCLKIIGLAPNLPAPINRQVEQHNLPFILALHTMFISVLVAQKIHDQKTPKLFPKARADSARAYPCQQLVGPLPRPQRHRLSHCTIPRNAPGPRR